MVGDRQGGYRSPALTEMASKIVRELLLPDMAQACNQVAHRRAQPACQSARRANHLSFRFSCPAPFAKIFWFSEIANHFITPPSTSLKGRIAIVTDAGLDAMDASGASDESVLLADGKIVWS